VIGLQLKISWTCSSRAFPLPSRNWRWRRRHFDGASDSGRNQSIIGVSHGCMSSEPCHTKRKGRWSVNHRRTTKRLQSYVTRFSPVIIVTVYSRILHRNRNWRSSSTPTLEVTSVLRDRVAAETSRRKVKTHRYLVQSLRCC
jgi:hypothetical protein